MNVVECDLAGGVQRSPFSLDRRLDDRRQVDIPVAVERRKADRRRGRPARITGTRSGRRRAFRLTADEDRALEALARENGECVTDLIRNAINEYVADFDEHRRPFKISG